MTTKARNPMTLPKTRKSHPTAQQRTTRGTPRREGQAANIPRSSQDHLTNSKGEVLLTALRRGFEAARTVQANNATDSRPSAKGDHLH